MSKSIVSNERMCYVCGTPYNLHKHHVYGGANRKKSEQYGCWIYLCAKHHNMSDEGIHFNKTLDTLVKDAVQTYWERENGTTEDFIKVFGKNYHV